MSKVSGVEDRLNKLETERDQALSSNADLQAKLDAETQARVTAETALGELKETTTALQKENGDLREAKEQLESENEELEKAAPRATAQALASVGVTASSVSTPGGAGLTAGEEKTFASEMKRLQSEGMSHRESVQAIISKSPKLYEDYLSAGAGVI